MEGVTSKSKLLQAYRVPVPINIIFLLIYRHLKYLFCEAKKTSYIKIIQLTKHGCNDGYQYIFAVALAVNSLILNVMFPKVVCL